MQKRNVLAIAGTLVLASGVALAGWFSKEELPPANAKPLSIVIKSLEDQGYRNIEEVEFSGGVWEVEVHQASGKEVEFHVDPVTAQIVKRE
jgi:hypothetical protein